MDTQAAQTSGQTDMRLWTARVVVAIFGALGGAFTQLNWLAVHWKEPVLPWHYALLRVGNGILLGAAVMLLVHGLLVWAAARFEVYRSTRSRFALWHALSYSVCLVPGLTALGVIWTSRELIGAIVAYWLVLNSLALCFSLPEREWYRLVRSSGWLAFLFFISGMAALIYQVTWQRALFVCFGVNIESVTVIVTIFMFGLGVGSLGGGRLSRRYPDSVLKLFLLCEVLIGGFGIASLPLIGAVASVTLRAPTPVPDLAIFALLSFPTFCMGATLPLLVAHIYRSYANVGKTVGFLYFTNTLGSAIACYLTTDFLFVVFGQQVAVLFAAACNITVGALVYLSLRGVQETPSSDGIPLSRPV